MKMEVIISYLEYKIRSAQELFQKSNHGMKQYTEVTFASFGAAYNSIMSNLDFASVNRSGKRGKGLLDGKNEKLLACFISH